MTTVAYRNGRLAADTLHCIAGMKANHSKISRCEDKEGREYLIASAGNVSDCAALEQWYKNGAVGIPQYTLFKDDVPTASALIVHEDGRVLYVDTYGHEISIQPHDFFAIGSGAAVAMGAMHAGATAVKAVEIAIMVDMSTGGTADCQTVDPRHSPVADEHQHDARNGTRDNPAKPESPDHASDQRHKEE